MSDDKYNGWTNYETWNVKLWMDNDEGSYHYWRDNAQELYNTSDAKEPFTKTEAAAFRLADMLKEEHSEAAIEQIPEACVFSDGRCVVAWVGAEKVGVHSIVIYDSLGDAQRVHGHGGLTLFVECLK